MSIRRIVFVLTILLITLYSNLIEAAEPKVAAGGDGVTASHSLAILPDGSLWAWGDNSSGQLGIGTTGGFVKTPTQVGTDTDWVDITAGYKFSMGLKSDGSLWTWGDNVSGQLGDGTGTTADKNKPIKILNNVISFAAGYYHALAVTSDGKLWAWGDNGFGQTGNGDETGADVLSPLQIGSETNWIKVGAGGFHSLAIKNDSTLYAFGNNSSGQLGYEEEVVKCLSPLNATSFSSCTQYDVISIIQPNKITPARVCSGTKSYTKTGAEGSLSIFTGVYTCQPSDINWLQVAAGEGHTMALKTDGTLWAVGNNGNGQLGIGTIPPTQTSVITKIGTDTNWQDVKSGAFHTLAKKSDGSLWGAGFNFFGQIGDGTTEGSLTFKQIGTENNWDKIAASGYHSLGLKTTPTLLTWGRNNFGQLGDGTIDGSISPKDISFPKLSVTPKERLINFDILNLDTESPVLTANVKSIGFKPTTTATVNISGDLTDFIFVSNTCENKTLSLNQTCDISYKFKPVTSGQKTLLLTINSNDIAEPSLPLTFRGTGRSTLTVTKTGYGTGNITSFPEGINCGTQCNKTFDAPQELTLFASANQGSEFMGWSGACSGTGTCNINTNTNANVTANFKETIPPTGAVFIENDSSYTKSSTVTLNLTCNDNISGCSMMQFSEDGTNWTNYETFSTTKVYTFQNSSEGEKTIYVKFKDNDGNISTSYSDKIIYDKTAPITFYYPSGGTYGTPQLITMYTNEPATIYYSLDGSTPTNIYNGVIQIDSSKSIKFYAQDTAGNKETERIDNYIIDTTPPTGTLKINNDAAITNNKNVTLTITCIDNESGCNEMRFSEDGINWTSPEAFQTAKNITLSSGDGNKIVYLSLKNSAGGWSSPITKSIKLDTTKPVTTATPNGGTFSTDQIVTLNINENATVYYTLDGTEPTTASAVYNNPIEITTSKTVKFFAVDTAGNSEDIKTITFVIDKTSPQGTVIINNGLLATNDRNIILTFNVTGFSDVTDVQITNDVEPTDFTTNVYPFNNNLAWLLSSGDGIKAVYVRFKNAAGNWSNIASDTIILDTIRPDVSTSKTSGTYNSDINVELTCLDAGSGCDKIYYTIDNSTPTTTSPIYTTPILISTNKTLKVMATDKAGNESLITTYLYSFDTTPPTGTITINNGELYTSSIYTSLALSGSESSSQTKMQFSNDGVTWTTEEPYNTSKIYEIPSGDGQKTVCVRYNDIAGNWSAPICDTIILDQTAPITTIAPASGLYNSSQTITLSVNEPATICYTTDGSDPLSSATNVCQNNPEQKLSFLITESRTIKYFAYDRAGNYEPITTRVFSIDTTPPTGVIFITEGSHTKSTTINLNITASDINGVAKMQFSNDGINWSSEEDYKTTKVWQLNSGDGEKTVYARFKDTAGNWSNPVTANILLDTTPPLLTITPSGGAFNSAKTVTITANENAYIFFTTDGTEPNVTSQIYVSPFSIYETTTLKYFAIDTTGNQTTVKTEHYVIDTISPTVSASLPTGIYNTAKTVVLSANEPATIYYTLNGTLPTVNSSVYTSPLTITETTTLKFIAKDTVGNISDVITEVYTIDTTPPTGSLIINSGATYTIQPQINLVINADDFSGIMFMAFSNDGTTWTTPEPYATTKAYTLTATDGTKTVYVRFTDNAGNTSDPISKTIILDTTKPTGTLTINNGAQATNNQTVNLTLSATDTNGIASMSFSNDGTSWSSPESFTTNKQWLLIPGDGEKTVYVRFTDNAGNTSDPISKKIIYDTTGASGTLAINNNALYTNTVSVTLTISATSTSGIATMSFSNDGTTWTTPEPYATTKAYTLTATDGTKTVYVRFTDNAGNTSNPVSSSIILDTTKPTGSITINNNAAITKTTAVTLTLSATDTNGIASMSFSNDGTTWTTPEPYATTKAYTLTTTDGTKTVYARFTDNAGNTSDPISKTIILDTTKPTGTLTINNGAQATNNQTVNLTLSATDTNGIASMSFSNDGTTWTTPEPYATTKAYTLTATDGTKTVYARFTDNAGNTSDPISKTIILDTTKPTGTISPIGGYYNSDQTITITPSETAIIYYTLDSTPPTTQSPVYHSPFTISQSTVIKFFVKDLSENISDTYTTSYIIDKAAPAGTLKINGDNIYTITPNVTLDITAQDASGIDKIQFSDDNINWTPQEIYTNTKNWTLPGPDGTKTVYVKIFDKAGNSTVISDSIILDTTPPTATITINDDAPFTNSTLVNIKITGTSPDTSLMSFSNDGNSWSTPETFSVSKNWELSAGDGMKTVYVTLRDNAGNWSAPFTKTIYLDTLPPVTIATPSGGKFKTSQIITLNANENGKTYFTIDGSQPTTSSTQYLSPIEITASTTIKFFSVDSAGNIEKTKTENYTIDVTPPVGTISIQNGKTHTNTENVTITINATDPNGVSKMQFSNDGLNWSAPEPYSTVKAWTLTTGDGTKTVYARFEDTVGNVTEPISDSIILDKTPPVVSIVPNAGVYNSKLNITLSTNETASIYYTTNGDDPNTSSSAFTSAFSIQSSSTIKFFAVDLAGNQSNIVSVSYVIDTAPPTGNISIAEGSYTKSTTINLNITASDTNGVAKMQFSNDGINWSSEEDYKTTKVWQLNSGDGEKTVYARFKDTAGNWSNPVTAKIVLDTTTPKSISSHTEGTYTGVITVSLSSNEPAAKIYYTTDGTEPTTISNLYSAPILIQNTTTLKFFAIDLAGNKENTNSILFTIKFQSDVTLTINNGSAYTNSKNITLSIVSTKTITEMQFSNDSTIWPINWQSFSASTNWSLDDIEGTKTVYARFKDSFGNLSEPVSASIILDKTAPVTNISVKGGLYNTPKQVTLSVNESSAKIYYTTDGAEPTENSKIFSGPINIDKTTTLKYFAKDAAGNKEQIKTDIFTIDTIPPTGEILINNGAKYTNSISVTLQLAATDQNGVTQLQISENGTTWTAPENFTGVIEKNYTLAVGDGDKTVFARFKDGAGNWSNAVSAKITLDTSPPTTTPSVSGGTINNAFNLSLVADETADIYYSIDNGQTYTKYFEAIPIITDTTIKFYAVDLANNKEKEQTITYSIDFLPPLNVVINNKNPYTNSKTVIINFSLTKPQLLEQETPVTMSFSNDGIVFSDEEPFNTSKEWILQGNDGIKTVYIRFKDTFGNISKSFINDLNRATITLDTVPPITTATPPSGIINSVPILITLSSNEENITIYYSTDGGNNYFIYTNPLSMTSSRTIYYYAKDVAGNIEDIKSVSYTVSINPSLTFVINGGEAVTNKTGVTLSIISQDTSQFAKMQFSNDGSVWSQEFDFKNTQSWTLSSTNGEKTVYLRIIDIYGNVSKTYTAKILLDNIAPIITSSLPSGKYYSTQFVTLTSNEAADIFYTTDGTIPDSNSLKYSNPIQIVTDTVLKFIGIDKVGNKSDIYQITYSIIPTETITLIGNKGLTREDGGDTTTNKDVNGNPKIDIIFSFGIVVKDSGGVPKSVRVYISDKLNPNPEDYIAYQLICSGDFSTGANCKFNTKLGPMPNLKYYFEVTLSDGNTIKYPQSQNSYDGPKIELLNGYNIIGLPRNISGQNLIAKDLFASTKIYRWLSDGVTTSTVNGHYELITNGEPKSGESYFVMKETNKFIPDGTANLSTTSINTTTITLRPGWNLISNPYNGNIKLKNINVIKNGTEKLSWLDAAKKSWIYNAIYYYKGSDWGSGYNFETVDGTNDSQLIPWIGYWLYLTKTDGEYRLELTKP